MDYMHHSALKSHGSLKSSNCLIDGRWILKISDYGLSCLREAPENDNDIYKGEKTNIFFFISGSNKVFFIFFFVILYNIEQLWTAPEILRQVPMPIKGSQKGDIYSFAIILQEIYYGCPPFCSNGDSIQVPKGYIIKLLYKNLGKGILFSTFYRFSG